MDPLNDAETNLRTIRQLMERATKYRAISGPVALMAGLLTTANCTYFAFFFPGNAERFVPLWTTSWYVILSLVLTLNLLLLIRHSKKTGAPLFNPRARMALLAVAPALLSGVILGATRGTSGPEFFWVFCYGLALCATSSFAPLALRILGISIVTLAVYGLVEGLPQIAYGALRWSDYPEMIPRILLMFIGFGLTHLFYAACVPWKIAPDD